MHIVRITKYSLNLFRDMATSAILKTRLAARLTGDSTDTSHFVRY